LVRIIGTHDDQGHKALPVNQVAAYIYVCRYNCRLL
jgi:hypothetical protein